QYPVPPDDIAWNHGDRPHPHRARSQGECGMKTRPLAAACRLMLPVVAVLALGACSTMSRKPASYSEVLGQAESEVAAGRVESALIGFNEAARIDPVNKEPW